MGFYIFLLSFLSVFFLEIALKAQDKLETHEFDIFITPVFSSPQMSLEKPAEKEEDKEDLLSSQIGGRKIIDIEAGLIFDENVLQVGNTSLLDTGTFLDKGSIRMYFKEEFKYISPEKNQSHFQLNFSSIYLYSLENEVSQGDPFIVALELPVFFQTPFGETRYGIGYSLFLKETEESTARKGLYIGHFDFFSGTSFKTKDSIFEFEFRVENHRSFLESLDEQNKPDGLRYAMKVEPQIFLSYLQVLGFRFGYLYHRSNERMKRYYRYDYGLFYKLFLGRYSAEMGYSGFILDYDKQKSGDSEQRRVYTEIETQFSPFFSLKMGLHYFIYDQNRCLEGVCSFDEKNQKVEFSTGLRFHKVF